jgi:hypothetical protein
MHLPADNPGIPQAQDISPQDFSAGLTFVAIS